MLTMREFTAGRDLRLGPALGLMALVGLTVLTVWASDSPPRDDGNQIDCALTAPEAVPNDDDPNDPRKSLRGDSDADGVISFQDVDCFIAALFGEEIWRACTDTSGLDFLEVNDINGDGVVNYNDIDAFIDLLLSQTSG